MAVKTLAVIFNLSSNLSWLNNSPVIFFCASDSSMHVQRMIQGAATFGRLQRPRLRIMWGKRLVNKKDIELNNIAGFLYFVLPEKDQEYLNNLGLPAVNVSSRNLPTHYASVTPDDRAAGVMAAKHFKENLFQHFAFIGLKSHHYSLMRGNAFVEELLPSHCQCLWIDEIKNSSEVIKNFLHSLKKPTGVLAANDTFARRICELALELSIGVPEELAILGVDADHLISLASPVALSSVDIDSFNIGYTAAEMLSRIFNDPTMDPTQITVPPKGVLVAASTNHLATEDTLTAKAVEVIREHACNGLTVEEVARKTGVNRRTLERHFRQSTGKGVDEQIRKVRIDCAIKMLDQSDLSISEIATGAASMTCFISPKYSRNP